MTLEEIAGSENLATKSDVKALELLVRERLVEIKEQLQRIKLLVWLPVIAAAAQIVVVIWHSK